MPKFSECYKNARSDDEYSACFKIVSDAEAALITTTYRQDISPVVECVTDAKSHHDIEVCAGLILPDKSITSSQFTELYPDDVYEAVRLSDVPMTSNQFIALYSADVYGVVTMCAKHKFKYNFGQVNVLRTFIVKRFSSLNLNREILEELERTLDDTHITEPRCARLGNVISIIFPPSISQPSETSPDSTDPASLAMMFASYSIVKACSENNIVYTQAKASAIKDWISKHLEDSKISESERNQAWDLIQKNY